MTRLEALKELLAKAEAGEKPRFGKYDLLNALGDWGGPAYQGSLDAAKALHDAVLPDWFVARLMEDPEGKGWTCHLEPRNAPGNDWVDADSDNPARAWLLAILKALIAEERDK